VAIAPTSALAGKFWAGELYIDKGKQLYNALGLQSKGLTSGFGLLSSNMRAASKKAKEAGIAGNLKGDGFQLGATYVIDRNGDCLAQFRQVVYRMIVPFFRLRHSSLI
jgi:hypothetical protein